MTLAGFASRRSIRALRCSQAEARSHELTRLVKGALSLCLVSSKAQTKLSTICAKSAVSIERNGTRSPLMMIGHHRMPEGTAGEPFSHQHVHVLRRKRLIYETRASYIHKGVSSSSRGIALPTCARFSKAVSRLYVLSDKIRGKEKFCKRART